MNLAVVGTGYVGLVTAACFAEMGNDVCCIDINPEIIDNLRAGHIHIHEPGLESLVKRNTEEGRLTFTTDLAEGIAPALFIFNCVGTPPRPDGSCDLSYVQSVGNNIGALLDEYKIIINKSTVPVGTAEELQAIIQGKLDERGVRIEFDVVSNPEFLKEGAAVRDFLKPDRIIVGECRGGEALDMLPAMNTGHDGSLTRGIVARLDLQLARLDEFLPVLFKNLSRFHKSAISLG